MEYVGSLSVVVFAGASLERRRSENLDLTLFRKEDIVGS